MVAKQDLRGAIALPGKTPPHGVPALDDGSPKALAIKATFDILRQENRQLRQENEELNRQLAEMRKASKPLEVAVPAPSAGGRRSIPAQTLVPQDLLLISAFNAAVSAKIIAKRNGTVIRANPAAMKLLGPEHGNDLFGLIIDRLVNSSHGELEKYPAGSYGRQLLRQLDPPADREEIRERLKVRVADGSLRDMLLSMTYMRDSGGRKKYLLISLSDNEAFNKDDLTRLFRRQVLDDALERHVAVRDRATRAGKMAEPLSLASLDVDHFKRINDTYGHPAGDEVLRQVAAIIADDVRKEDLAARYGGEEFMALMVNTDIAGAWTIAERVRKTIEGTPVRVNVPAADGGETMETLHVTVSIGLASYEKGDTSKTLLSRADEALYKAKHGGRNRVEGMIGPDPKT